MTDGFFEDEVSILGLLILLLTRDGLPILFYTFSVSGRVPLTQKVLYVEIYV